MISVIIPWYDNGDILRVKAKDSLFKALMNQDYEGEIEIIVVSQESIGMFYAAQELKVKEIHLVKEGLFNKSWCINVGVKNATFDTVLVIDADMMIGLDYVRLAMYYFNERNSRNIKFCMGWNNLILLPGRDNEFCRTVTPAYTEACGGTFIFDKSFFIYELGMMNEMFEGYGGEDNDLYYRVMDYCKRDKEFHLYFIPIVLAHHYHHWSILIKNNVTLMDIARENPEEIRHRLRWKVLGNIEGPVKIEMMDLIKGTE